MNKQASILVWREAKLRLFMAMSAYALYSAVAFQQVPLAFGLSVYEIVGLACLAIAIPYFLLIQKGLHIESSFFVFSIIAYCIFLTVSFLVNGEEMASARPLIWAVFPAILSLLLRGQLLTAGLVLVFFSGVTLSIFSIGQKFGVIPVYEFVKVARYGNLDPFDWGYTGLLSARGSFGITLMLSLAAGSILVRKISSFIKKRVVFGLMLLIPLAALASGSRSTMVAIAVYFFVYFFFYFSLRKLKIGVNEGSAAPLLIIMLTLLAVALLLAGVGEKVLEGLVNVRPESVDSRLIVYEQSLSLPISGYLFGFGSDFPITTFGHAVHNGYLSILVERGVFPFLAFFFVNMTLLVVLVTPILRSGKRFSTSSVDDFALLASFCGVQVEMLLFSGYGSISYWACVGFLYFASRSLKNEKRRRMGVVPARKGSDSSLMELSRI